MRMIQEFKNTEIDRVVKVYRNSEWNEYVCRLLIDGKHYEPADSFTDDKQDALGTAVIMCRNPA